MRVVQGAYILLLSVDREKFSQAPGVSFDPHSSHCGIQLYHVLAQSIGHADDQRRDFVAAVTARRTNGKLGPEKVVRYHVNEGLVRVKLVKVTLINVNI